MSKKTSYVCDQIDRLMTVEFRVYELDDPGKPQSRGTIARLYDAARSKTDRALTQLSAEGLAESINRGDVVIITTGWLLPFWAPHGETDGTPGALAIARALSIGSGARVVFITEQAIAPVIAAGCLATGLRVYELEFFLNTRNLGEVGGVSIIGFTVNQEDAPAEARRVLDQLDPKAVVAIEKAGRNHKGVYHTGLGNDFSETAIKVDYLVDEARARGIFTVGIIDIGNEIGSGNIVETVRDIMPFGCSCKCPCGGGMASTVETHALIVASACNFGGYALVAALAAEYGNLDIAHSRETERLIMQECGRAGAIDGGLLTTGGFRNLNGVAFDDYAPLIDLMRTIVKSKDIQLQVHLLRK
jgi:D-glutamate cyclase